MDSQEVGVWLEDCLEAASQQAVPPSEEARLSFCRNREALCAELALLLREAVEMKWPFVPEKWQYKKSPGSRDKANLTDLIRRHLLQLLALLKASIAVGEACWALAVVFLVDRFLYWMDESSRLLKITKLLHRRHPDTPVAPQLVIRQARVYLNSGKLQKAEYILSNLINSSGATGCWTYHSESDRVLVQAVSVQVRGLVLQKLGLWLEAAELVWASLVGYYALPQPDKKGIGTSLGVLANILVSMNDEDFRAFKTNPDIDLSFLGDSSHRLLSAAEAAKMAVVYSQYASLYVLTNVAAQGTCLLSYSFSIGCPPSERRSFLLRAREAFEIGLLTKAEGEPVISKQELHTFIKAAYSLTVVHKWLGVCPEWTQAVPACQKALARFYDYCHAGSQERDVLCGEIMRLVGQVKGLLQVKRFPNSDAGSFIPDSYRNITERPIDFTLSRFSLVIGRFRKYHASLCEADGGECSGRGAGRDGWRLCITALGTTVGALARECATESCGVTGDAAEEEPPQEEALCAHPESPPQKEELGSTLGSTDSSLGSSWQEFSLSRSPRPGSSAGELQRNAEGGVRDSRSGGDLEGNRNQTNVGYKAVVSSKAAQGSTSSTGSDMEQFEVLQAAIETVGSEDWITDILSGSPKPSGTSGATQSVSQLNLGMSSSSPNGSFSSQSSWEKISPVPNSPDPRKTSQPKPGERQSSEPFGSGDSFSLLVNPDTGDSADDHKCPAGAAPGGGGPASPKPGSLQSYHVDVNAETETDSPPYSPRPAAQNPSSACRAAPGPCAPGPCGSTEDSAGSPFEVLEGKEAGWAGTKHGGEKTSPSGHQNPSCYSCLKQNAAGSASPERPYLLTQQDYRALLAGICHECLLKRLQSDKTKFKIKKHRSVYSALHLKFSRATGLWTGRQTCAYIGEPMGMQGKQRAALWVQFLHQEERLSSYVGKDYLVPKEIQFHLNDVERQMTAQYYVTEFNKRLYEQEVTAQIFFIPSEVLMTLEGGEITGCITVEPYMLGDFVKLTNNTGKKDERFRATEYGIAFGHFAYQFSGLQEVVVDLQGWVTANGKGLTYLTDPQIHSLRTPRGPSNFADRGLKYFLEEQHGPECNVICRWLKLPRVGGFPPK